MDDLIEIIVRLIIGAFSGPKKVSSQSPASRAPVSSSRTVPPPQRAQTAPQRGQTPAQRKTPPQVRRQVRRSVPPPIAIAAPIMTASNAPAPAVTAAYVAPGRASDGAATAHTAKSSANATLLRKWLNPTTLQQQFMLTEILQPPIALRPIDPNK
jgi:hypothetical protein